MSETAVERRLREMADCYRGIHQQDEHVAAWDAGRKALALLRRYDIGLDMPDFDFEDWEADVAALLARCEGEK